MNQKSSSRVNQFETIPTLYTTCLNYVCVNIELLTRTVKTTLPTGQKSHQHRHHHHNYTHCPYYHSIEFRQKTVSLNHVISEDLVERLSALNKITDSTLSLFGTASSVCCLKKLHLKNCLISKDVLKLVLKNQNIDELKLNNIQIHAPPVIYGTAQSSNFGNTNLFDKYLNKILKNDGKSLLSLLFKHIDRCIFRLEALFLLEWETYITLNPICSF